MTPQRLFDIGLALILLPFALPVMAVIAILIVLRDGRPVIYGAERMKTPDRAFRLWKFRTMATAAADAGVSGGDKADRVTPLGRRLRATRLDELPQLWNILRGDIGFVGPRPPLRLYVERFPDLYREVLKSRPGVTGLASLRIHGYETRLLAATRSAAETDSVYCRRCVPKKARMDLLYQKHRSLCLDLSLIWQTGRGLFWRVVNRTS
jgi:lipopolysaccharide/colanic/teichoic acid biosynthesis glycosyltransferase